MQLITKAKFADTKKLYLIIINNNSLPVLSKLEDIKKLNKNNFNCW